MDSGADVLSTSTRRYHCETRYVHQESKSSLSLQLLAVLSDFGSLMVTLLESFPVLF